MIGSETPRSINKEMYKPDHKTETNSESKAVSYRENQRSKNTTTLEATPSTKNRPSTYGTTPIMV